MPSLVLFTLAFILAFLALVLLCAYFVHVKILHDSLIFTVSREGLGEQSGKVKALLLKMKATEKEVTNTLLLIEEIVMRLYENTQQVATIRIHRSFRNVYIRLSARGNAYNPIAEIPHDNPDDEDNYRNLIFASHKAKLTYHRLRTYNIIILRVRSV